MSRLPRQLVSLVLSAAVTLAGCSDDNTGADAPSTSTASAAPTPAGSRDPAAEAAAAARINLTTADLGSAWTRTPSTPDEADDVEYERDLYACVGATPADDLGDDLLSDDFSNESAAQRISSSVDFYASADDAKRDIVAVFAGPKAEECLRASLETTLREDETLTTRVGAVTLDRAPELATVPDSFAFRLTASAVSNGRPMTVTAEFVSLVRGRIGATVFSLRLGGSVPGAVTKAVGAVAERADAEARRTLSSA